VKRLWILLAIVLTFGFTVLGWVGSRIYQDMPPIPERIVTSDGRVVASDGNIRAGQAVWQTMGGMEVGSIWGHGSYVAPDWTADWLHRECELILDDWARVEHARPYADLEAEPKAALRERLRLMLRANRYEPATGTLTIEPVRARAFEANQKHFAAVFSQGKPEYAIPRGRSAIRNGSGSSPPSSSGPPGHQPPPALETPSPTRATGPTSRSSATFRRPRPSCGPG